MQQSKQIPKPFTAICSTASSIPIFVFTTQRFHFQRVFSVVLFPTRRTSIRWTRYNTNLRLSITVRLTSLFCMNPAALLKLNDKQFYFQKSQTGGQPYNGTHPHCKCSLAERAEKIAIIQETFYKLVLLQVFVRR